MEHSEQTWSSGRTFILAAIGAAVGLGNIWKFPYVVGVNGGGAFVLIYIACVVFVAIPNKMIMRRESTHASEPRFRVKSM